MAGWTQKEGILKDNSKVNLFSIITHSLLSKQFKTTTYKYCFFKSLLDNIYKSENFTISFDDLSFTFSQIYWNMINVHHIPQMSYVVTGNKSQIENLIEEINSKNPSVNGVRYESIPAIVQRHFQNKMKNIFQAYVIGAFYEENDGYLYGFSKKNKLIYLNEKSISFLINHKIVLEQLCYYEWLKMCESVLASYNKYIPNLTTIFEEITLRKDLTLFKEQLDKLKINKECFYDGKKTNSLSLDHVIPWSYLKTDDLWNLVWCCKTCNSSKNDKVPQRKYIDELIKRNKKFNIKSPNVLKIYNDAIINGVEIWNKR